MDLEMDRSQQEPMVVLAADGDDRERRELAAVLRSLAQAMDDQDLVGNPLLVLEQRCYERLMGLHRRAVKAAGGQR
jgi:hypothetical protein